MPSFRGRNDGNAPLPTGVGAGMDMKPYDQPSEVSAEDGEVQLDGPDGVAIAFTPEAAEETSQRLLLGAMAGHAQRERR